MCAETAHLSSMPVDSFSASSIDCLSLLHENEGEVFYVSLRNSRGSQYYLSRQAFLRSYQFCLEETFKDKLRRSVRRLNEESLDGILKQTLKKWMRASKVILNRHSEVCYQFCLEEPFKDKLRRSVRRLNEESLDEILKQKLTKWMRATKVFLIRHCEVVVERKTKQRMNLWPVACFHPTFVPENKYECAAPYVYTSF